MSKIKLIYIKKESSAQRVLLLIDKAASKKVILVARSGSVSLSDLDQAKLIAREARGKNIDVVIATDDSKIRENAKLCGFSVMRGNVFQSARASTKPASPSLGFAIRYKTFLNKLPNLPKPQIYFTRKILGYLSGITAILLVVAVLVLWVLPEATIALKIRTEPVALQREVTVSSAVSQISGSDLIVPGEIIEQEIEGVKVYNSTGTKNVGKSASGFVQIYNFSVNTLVLRAETTVLSVNGRTYRFTQDVGNIRPTAMIGLEDRVVDPSSLVAPIPVVADGPGEEYNLSANSRIEITNAVLGAQPDILYGVVYDGGVTGGTTETVRVVSQGDVLLGLEDLQKSLVENARNELQRKKPDFRLLNRGIESEIVDQAVTAEVGQETNQFEAAMKLKLRALTYNETDVLSVIESEIKRTLPERQYISPKSPSRFLAEFIIIDLEKQEGVLSVHYEGHVEFNTNLDALREMARGKTETEVKELFISRSEIENVEIDFYPFWVQKVPRFSKKVFIETLDSGQE